MTFLSVQSLETRGAAQNQFWRRKPNGNKSHKAGDYDYYVFAFFVPGQTCEDHHCKKINLDLFADKTLNIHGLWPNKNDGNLIKFSIAYYI
jgi:ribonuclease I